MVLWLAKESSTWLMSSLRLCGGMKRGDFLFELFIFCLEMGNSLDEWLYGCLYFLVDGELHRFIFIKNQIQIRNIFGCVEKYRD